MDEYIEREEIMNRLFTEYATDSKADVFELIRSIPAADVQPVRYGQWIWDGNKEECICSECGKGNLKYSTVFCPDCGAKFIENL